MSAETYRRGWVGRAGKGFLDISSTAQNLAHSNNQASDESAEQDRLDELLGGYSSGSCSLDVTGGRLYARRGANSGSLEFVERLSEAKPLTGRRQP